MWLVQRKMETNLEITLLASLISLTPGTDSRWIFQMIIKLSISILFISAKEEMIHQIHHTFERAILEVTK